MLTPTAPAFPDRDRLCFEPDARQIRQRDVAVLDLSRHQESRRSMVCTGAVAAYLVESIIHDQKKIIPCCTYLEGEYGQSDICIGVPVVIGKDGIEEIVDYKLEI